MEVVNNITLANGAAVRIEIVIEDIVAQDEQGYPVSIYDRKYLARYPDGTTIILHKENGLWRDDLNPITNGTDEKRNELKTAILDHNL